MFPLFSSKPHSVRISSVCSLPRPSADRKRLNAIPICACTDERTLSKMVSFEKMLLT